MEHSISTSSGTYHMYKDHPLLMCTTTAEVPHKNKPSFRHSNLHSNSMCSPASHDARPASQVHPGCMPIEPFRSQGRDTHVSSSHNKPDASSSLHEPSAIHDNSSDEALRTHDINMPPGAPLAQYNTSPEALLDVILVAQKKLQQLQVIAELLVQPDGQAAHEQQQSQLVARMKSIMSQLCVAMADFCGQSATCLKQNVEPASQALDRGTIEQISQALDLSFDDYHSNDLNTFILSRLAAPNEGFFPISSISMCSESTQSTMELNVRLRSAQAPMGLDVTTSAMELAHTRGLKDPQLKKQGLNLSASRNQGANHLQHNNTPNMLVENKFSNESVVETCDTYGNRNQELMFGLEDNDYANMLRDDDDDDIEGENLPPGSYELVEMAAAEILAEHTHFCEICGKGFKRDANLRMHMRGHGDEYKTPAALARPVPDKGLHMPSCNKLRRYSCPYVGCKRNKKHRKFQPLKTTLCVKNHYRRSHCPKLLICSKCKTKRFSVVADLKTHEKHCGQDKWQCSCGTTFSRKDKLVGHVTLFAGHTPAVPIHETEGLNEPATARDQGDGLLEGLSTIDMFSTPSEDGQTHMMNTLIAESDDGNGAPDLDIMGEGVLMRDKYGQSCIPATHVYPSEKSSLADNFERGAMQVMQHCG